MKRLFATLSKMDRRRYAAVEAAKLGSSGISAISALFGLDAKTVRCGLTELALLENSTQVRVRKKAVGMHPDCNAQFERIAKLKAGYGARGEPVRSIDTKKKADRQLRP